MFCYKCGHPVNGGNFCPNCGATVQQAEPVYAAPPVQEPAYTPAEEPAYTPAQEPVFTPVQGTDYTEDYAYNVQPHGTVAGNLVSKYKEIFSHPLFFVACILFSASAVLNLFVGVFNVLTVLLVIAFWLLFAGAKSAGYFKTGGLKLLSGTIKAGFILNWVLVGLLVLVAIIMAFGAYALSMLQYMVDISEFYYFMAQMGLGGMDYEMLIIALTAVIVLAIVCVIIVNICFIGKLHKFAKSLCTSAETGVAAFRKVRASRRWLFVLGVLSGIGTVLMLPGWFSMGFGFVFADLISVLISGAMSAAYILFALWIKKFFVDC